MKSTFHIFYFRCLEQEDNTDSTKGYPYQGCVGSIPYSYSTAANTPWKRIYGDVENSFSGAESCGLKCKMGGYKYWGLECPRSTIHCQCGADTLLESVALLDDEKCNSGPKIDWCVGPFTSSMNEVQYFHGAADISSVYLTEKSGG